MHTHQPPRDQHFDKRCVHTTRKRFYQKWLQKAPEVFIKLNEPEFHKHLMFSWHVQRKAQCEGTCTMEMRVKQK